MAQHPESNGGLPTERTTVDEVHQDLMARAPENNIEPRLEPMRQLMQLLGDPQRCAPVIHLTGTNGKTSTSRMIESVLRAYGLRTGRYTSPHLVSVTERISVDGQPVADETFVHVWNEIAPILDVVDAQLVADGQNRLTYFEALTALGFAVFADAPVEVMVLEVGLGGITDATNVADAGVSVVTPISLDHTDLLGDSVREIAEEKSGIIKPHGFLVSAAQEPDAAQVLLDTARDVEAEFRFEGVEFGVQDRNVAVGGQVISVKGLAAEYTDVMLPLHGGYQAENAALAIAALEAFLGGGEKPLEKELLAEGLQNTTSPGRLEVLRTEPTLLVDAAHNPAGMDVTAAAVQEAFNFEKIVLVVAILQEKDAVGILSTLLRVLGEDVGSVVLTQSASPRAIPAEDLKELALDAGWDEELLRTAEELSDALEIAVTTAQDPEFSDEGTGAGILATGSITLVGDLRRALGPGPDQAEAGVVVDSLDIEGWDEIDLDDPDLDPAVLDALDLDALDADNTDLDETDEDPKEEK